MTAAASCPYCCRQMAPPGTLSLLERTRDHVLPRRMRSPAAAAVIVACCWQCNQVKGDMSPEEWRAYRTAYPRWWERPENQRPRNPPAPRLSAAHRRAPLTADDAVAAVMKRFPGATVVDARLVAPAAVPVAYEDERQQAAFEAVYRGRLHLLRVKAE